MLPLDWLPRARPKRGEILVRRLEESYTFEGWIWIPESARSRARPPFARILAVADGVDPRWEYEVGDLVALNPVAGVRVLFGNRDHQEYLYAVPPGFIVCGIAPEFAEKLEEKGESPRRLPGRDPRESMVVEERRDHGRFKA